MHRDLNPALDLRLNLLARCSLDRQSHGSKLRQKLFGKLPAKLAGKFLRELVQKLP
jgi:hypothetical protein